MSRNAGGSGFLALVVFVGLAASSSEAHAQGPSAAPGSDPQSERVQEINFTLDVRHDSNSVRAEASRAAARGLSLSDERATLGVGLNVARMLGRNSIKANAFVGYDFYRKNTRLNRERLSLSADAGLLAGPCGLNLLPQFSRRQSELAELDFLDTLGVLGVKNTETIQVYRAELRCGREQGLRPLLTYERSFGNNSNLRRQIQNYRGERYGGGVSYSNVAVGDLNLSYERQTLNYPRRVFVGAGGVEGYRVEDYKLSIRREIGSVLTANGYIAHTTLRPKNSVARPFKGLSWSLGLSAAPSDQLQVSAFYAKALTPSLGVDALYTISRDLGLNATYRLSQKTSIGFAASRAWRDYRGASSNVSFLLRNHRLTEYSANVQFRANDRLTFRLLGGHERRNASQAFYDYGNTFVALNIAFSLGSR